MTTSTQALPVLYSFRRCPFAMRARLGLWASGMPYVLREVVLANKPQTMLTLSPKGTVPVLHLPSGEVIDESLDIMAWALTEHDPLGWRDHRDDDLIRACDTDFKFHLDRYKYATRYDNSDPLEHRSLGEAFVLGLDQRLTAQPFLGGLHPRLTDMAIAPFVRQFALPDWEWFFHTPYVHVQGWLNAFISSAAFAQVMDKRPPWRDGDEDTLVNPPPH
ncbi:glutathione S-transferase [Magnetovibrio blakemorei]|uniref:GST N-terminal domain-containing protein n=1 Tax=Magnetovibrio blakemorei TaxID=28181 RepID=A0A1E5Q448_9PROT|nr:glutathione S-transferase [Magnetovibrio blakemorei]OEJ64335.1 hypothetical protein BEN30_16795 [Magnetovibrio blakemorei]